MPAAPFLTSAVAHLNFIRRIPRISWLFTAVSLLAFVNAASAQEEGERPEWIISAECRMIMVPQKLAFGLIEELGDPAKIDAAWTRVLDHVERGEIEVLANLVVRGVPDEELQAKTGEEVNYPVDFDSSTLPDRLPEKNPLEVLKAWPAVAVIPSRFETRHVGYSLVVDASVSKGGNRLTVKAVPRHERLLRWTKFEIGRLASGAPLSIDQPVFHTMQNSGIMHLRTGQRVLLGVHKSPEPKGKSYELFVFRITATAVPPPR